MALNSEEEVLRAFNELEKHNFISRIGPVIQPNHIGLSTLVAMSVPADQLVKVANIVSHFPEVNHNYEREHSFNLWFVLIAADQQHISSVLAEIESQSGFKAMPLPLLKDYFINLGFQLDLEDVLPTELASA
jgi:DNA-binding Lrp family transcriptional regulator